jgi:hypothetical protein
MGLLFRGSTAQLVSIVALAQLMDSLKLHRGSHSHMMNMALFLLVVDDGLGVTMG